MTPFSEIYDLAIITMGDYKIKNLIAVSQDSFYTYMRSLLTTGIISFSGCLQSLDFTSQEETDDTSGDVTTVWYFVEDLSFIEKSILARTVILQWWEQKLQEVTVFQGSIPDKNFSKMEIANGLKQKSEYKDKLNEEIGRLIGEYQCDNLSSLPFFGGI